jgi:hypothetical protein
MRSIAIRTLVALGAVGIFVSRGDAATRSVSAEPLTVFVGCEYGLCQAEAYGGSGTGYSFTWTKADEISDADGYSSALPRCANVTTFGIAVGVTVTDSNSNTASVMAGAICDENYQYP